MMITRIDFHSRVSECFSDPLPSPTPPHPQITRSTLLFFGKQNILSTSAHAEVKLQPDSVEGPWLKSCYHRC